MSQIEEQEKGRRVKRWQDNWCGNLQEEVVSSSCVFLFGHLSYNFVRNIYFLFLFLFVCFRRWWRNHYLWLPFLRVLDGLHLLLHVQSVPFFTLLCAWKANDQGLHHGLPEGLASEYVQTMGGTSRTLEGGRSSGCLLHIGPHNSYSMGRTICHQEFLILLG